VLLWTSRSTCPRGDRRTLFDTRTCLLFALLHFTSCSPHAWPRRCLRRLAATTKHTHHHRRPMTSNNRQPQTATRHVPPLTPCERSRVLRRVCRVAGPLFHGGNAIVFGRFLGVTEITPPLKPIPCRPVVASAQFPGGNSPAQVLGLAGCLVRMGQVGAVVGCVGRISLLRYYYFVVIDVDAIARQSCVHSQASQVKPSNRRMTASPRIQCVMHTETTCETDRRSS
jgi:hypothetical protein